LVDDDQYRKALEHSARTAADAVGEDIALSFLPKELIAFCYGVTKAYHERHGYKDLSQNLMEKNSFVCILMHKDLRELMGGILWCKKISIGCFVLCAVMILISFAWSGWIALGIIPCFGVAFVVGKRYQELRLMVVARLLALELVNDDFIGLSKYLPILWETAHRKIELCFPTNHTRFLDFYIPSRGELERSELQGLLKGRLLPE